jgi:tetratricopeptide (TPR) repeat protein
VALYQAWGKPDRLAELERTLPRVDEAALERNARLLRERLDDRTLLASHASLLFQLHHYGEAEAAYRALVTLSPNDAGLHQSVGDACNLQGRFVEAEAPYREAIRLDPLQGGHHHNFADSLLNRRKYAEAAVEYAEAVRLRPATFASHYSLGTVSAFLGRWDVAARAYEGAAPLAAPTDINPTYRWAHLSACTADAAAYERARRAILDRFANTTDPRTAHDAARACALLPGPSGDPQQLARLVQTAMTDPDAAARARYQTTKALVDYRAGDFASAAETLAHPAPTAGRSARDASSFSILAMARLRSGNAADARAAADDARRIITAKMPNPENGQIFGEDVYDWLEAQTLCREAEQTLKDPAPATRPTH